MPKYAAYAAHITTKSLHCTCACCYILMLPRQLTTLLSANAESCVGLFCSSAVRPNQRCWPGCV
jgi:hypothetical protein